MSIETVRGRQATIHFDPRKCIHSRHSYSHPSTEMR